MSVQRTENFIDAGGDNMVVRGNHKIIPGNLEETLSTIAKTGAYQLQRLKLIVVSSIH